MNWLKLFTHRSVYKEQPRKLQDAQAEKLTSLQAQKLKNNVSNLKLCPLTYSQGWSLEMLSLGCVNYVLTSVVSQI